MAWMGGEIKGLLATLNWRRRGEAGEEEDQDGRKGGRKGGERVITVHLPPSFYRAHAARSHHGPGQVPAIEQRAAHHSGQGEAAHCLFMSRYCPSPRPPFCPFRPAPLFFTVS